MKSNARVITLAWGEGYVRELLSFTLPAVLSPGNLPFLSETFNVEFVLLTERRLFEVIRKDPIFALLSRLCKVNLVQIDDLVVHKGMYGLSLTYAYHRGFSDLGDRMLDYYLFFLNGDFIVAKGCYRTVVERLNAGAKLIVAPSYCVDAETVMPILESQMDPSKRTLSIPPREMASIALTYRHNTIRGKTVNQSLFHTEWIEQFYWNVDEHTLLGHQLPLAIVCLKPERVYIEPVTFWDYGLISEICPNWKPCVLGDSDDFVMIELREMERGWRELSPGQDTVQEIAKKMSSFTTADQRTLGLHSLTLHDEDLPSNVESARIQLKNYVQEIYSHLSEPLSYRNHKFWVYHQWLLKEFLKDKGLKVPLLGLSLPDLEKRVSRNSLNQIKILNNGSGEVQHKRSLLDRLYDRLFGKIPRVTKNHPLWRDFNEVLRAIDDKVMGKRSNRLVIGDDEGYFSRMLMAEPGFFVSIPAEVAVECKISPINESLLEKFVPLDCELEQVGTDGFDLCVCVLGIRYFPECEKIYQNVKPSLRPGAKFIAYFTGPYGHSLSEMDAKLILSRFYKMPQARILINSWEPNLDARIARGLFRLAAWLKGKFWVFGHIGAAFLMMVSLVFSRIANHKNECDDKYRKPKVFMSVMIEIG